MACCMHGRKAPGLLVPAGGLDAYRLYPTRMEELLIGLPTVLISFVIYFEFPFYALFDSPVALVVGIAVGMWAARAFMVESLSAEACS